MNNLKDLMDYLNQDSINATFDYDPAEDPNGSSWLDIRVDNGLILVVEYKPEHGYRLYFMDDENSDKPQEIYLNVTSLSKRLVMLIVDNRKHISLKELREITGVSQIEMSKRLEINQASISKMEARDDILLTSLQKYISALGGEVKINVSTKDFSLDLDISRFSGMLKREIAEELILEFQVERPAIDSTTFERLLTKKAVGHKVDAVNVASKTFPKMQAFEKEYIQAIAEFTAAKHVSADECKSSIVNSFNEACWNIEEAKKELIQATMDVSDAISSIEDISGNMYSGGDYTRLNKYQSDTPEIMVMIECPETLSPRVTDDLEVMRRNVKTKNSHSHK